MSQLTSDVRRDEVWAMLVDYNALAVLMYRVADKKTLARVYTALTELRAP